MSQANIESSTSIVRVGLGTFRVDQGPGTALVSAPLGSCLGVVMYDTVKRTGGLLHSLLPDSSRDPDKARENPALFLDTGFLAMLDEMEQGGSKRENILIYAAGGSEIFDDSGIFNFGSQGGGVLAGLLSDAGLALEAQDIGGHSAKSLRLHLGTGAVTIQYSGSTKPKSLCKQ